MDLAFDFPLNRNLTIPNGQRPCRIVPGTFEP